MAIAKAHGIWVVQDLAYADIVFDGYTAPSILQVPGAMDVAVEFFTLSKSYNMPGWRIGFCVGNETLIGALARIKSYLDYGSFTPIQVAAIAALEGDQQCVSDITDMYKRRRDVLCDGLNAMGWEVTPPKATMFVWAKIPPQFAAMGSLEFAKLLIDRAKVAVSPGIGFGQYGDDHVRFALIENEHRTRQALRGLKKCSLSHRSEKPEPLSKRGRYVRIGICGAGTVAQGVVQILRDQNGLMSRLNPDPIEVAAMASDATLIYRCSRAFRSLMTFSRSQSERILTYWLSSSAVRMMPSHW